MCPYNSTVCFVCLDIHTTVAKQLNSFPPLLDSSIDFTNLGGLTETISDYYKPAFHSP